MKESNLRHKVIALILSVLFLTYYGNTTLFQHTHYIDNTPVTHSHPYSGGSHSHSTASFLSLSVLNHIVLTAISGLFIHEIFRTIIAEYTTPDKIHKVDKNTLSVQLRAPPVI